ncbi:hypothetical protein [Methylobacterium pseudosasicola]|uniref:hypothetical protein n=1 Tax=Methylobacterium pseudosasicola TaxID=582667 RepID=UPI0011144277|nr:hypothetical protein [Methylobacterium pseudosasicola]
MGLGSLDFKPFADGMVVSDRQAAYRKHPTKGVNAASIAQADNKRPSSNGSVSRILLIGTIVLDLGSLNGRYAGVKFRFVPIRSPDDTAMKKASPKAGPAFP